MNAFLALEARVDTAAVDDELALEEGEEVVGLLVLDDADDRGLSTELIINTLGEEGRCAKLVLGRVQTLPVVDNVELLANRVLVGVEDDVAIALEELAQELLVSDLDLFKVLDAPGLDLAAAVVDHLLLGRDAGRVELAKVDRLLVDLAGNVLSGLDLGGVAGRGKKFRVVSHAKCTA